MTAVKNTIELKRMKKTRKSKQLECYLHGEALIIKGVKLPKDVVPVQPSHQKYHVIADSETTGNHHVVDCNEGVSWFKSSAGTLFAEVEKETQVRCLHADRHDAITLSPGTYEFGSQQEFDHAEQHSRNVKD